jgi:hypothetical protein
MALWPRLPLGPEFDLIVWLESHPVLEHVQKALAQAGTQRHREDEYAARFHEDLACRYMNIHYRCVIAVRRLAGEQVNIDPHMTTDRNSFSKQLLLTFWAKLNTLFDAAEAAHQFLPIEQLRYAREAFQPSYPDDQFK